MVKFGRFTIRFFLVNIGAKNSLKNSSVSTSQQSFYYPSRVVVNEELYLYPLLSMLSEWGGYVGLMLGVSILQGVLYVVGFITRQIEQYELADEKEHKKKSVKFLLDSKAVEEKYECKYSQQN